MTAKHTPGPYRLLITPNEVKVRVGRGATEYDWSEPLYGGEDADEDAEVVATARLFSAAPDLLAACQSILGLETHEPSPAWDMIRAAIAKATGV